ncbi:hypothetical protein HY994_06195 [Candidatus Micrarchaeota archaeon]|nr:hypothetical protein [Candidatus Micrarchaeota archaeon]
MFVFQLLLLVLLSLPLVVGNFGPLVFAGAYAAVLTALAFKAFLFEARHRFVALLFLAVFAGMSLGATLSLLAGFSVFWIAGGMVAVLAAFFVAMAWKFSTAECVLVGWTNGYAVVKVVPSLVTVMPAGIHAVACHKKPVGKTVKVRFSFLNKIGKVV